MSKGNTIAAKFKGLKKGKKIQFVTASVLTISLMVAIPTYAWFSFQREIARLERIKSPDVLFITAADREDKINIDMNNIDVNAKWNTSPDETPATYKYFVFAVAGQYVTSYNLQLAHTKNNNYKYEIFEAYGTTTEPSDVEEKDYVAYDRTKNIPTELSTIESKYGSADTYPTIYYSVKQDYYNTDISLNQGMTYTITPADQEHDVTAVTKSYNGQYLNFNIGSGTSEFDRLANSSYHTKTYNYDKVEPHSEPLYWQATRIPVETVGNDKNPFYHEYILKVSWDPTANLTELSRYKDTDMVYITVKV